MRQLETFSSHSRFARISFALSAVVMLSSAVALMACDPGQDVTFENRTGQVISIFRDNDLEAKLSPGDERTFSFITYQGSDPFLAKDETGNVLLKEEYTWDDLRSMHWRIVIRPKQ